MPEPGEGDNADGQRLEHPVVALERCGVPVPGPVGLEDDLRHLAAAIRSAPFGEPRCSSTMSGCLVRTLSNASQMRR